MFKATTSWLKKFLIDNGYKNIANQINNTWCWPTLGEFAKTVPAAVLELVTQEVIKAGDVGACYKYCLYVQDRDDVREAMIKAGDGWVCYCYCLYVQDRADVREAMIKSVDGWACYCYCRNVQDRDDVREALIQSGDGEACSYYCQCVQDRDDVRAVANKHKLTIVKHNGVQTNQRCF